MEATNDSEASTSASSPTASGSTADTATDELFIRHRVRKRDTLAGLAVKYNVTVADIKRANGFQSDTAMFGKDTLLIPTKPLPLGPEYSAWAGMIVAHYGRSGGLASDGHLRATSAAALSELRGYYSTSPTPDRTPDFSDDDNLDDTGIFAPRGRRNRALPGEVELMARQASSQSTPAGFIDDRLRRRRNAEDDYLDEIPLDTFSMMNPNSSARGASPFRAPLFRSSTAIDHRGSSGSLNGGGASGGRDPNSNRSSGVGLNDLKEWHRKSLQWRAQLLNKLKRAASQPAMAVNGPTSISQAAEAALALASGLSGAIGSTQKEIRKAD